MNTQLNTATTNATTNASVITSEETLNELGKYKPYDAQLEIPEVAGTRIVKCLYRNKAGDKNAKQSVYVRVPNKHLSAENVSKRIDELLPHLVSFLESKEDEIIKAEHSAGALSLYTEKLSLEGILDYLEEQNSSSRLSGEAIKNWFSDEIEGKLAEILVEKRGIDIDSASEAELIKLQTVINAYKNKFALLAGSKTILQEEDKLALLSVIEKCADANSLMSKRLKARLENMKDASENLLELI